MRRSKLRARPPGCVAGQWTMLSHPELVLSPECILPDFLAHACDRILEIRPNTAVMPVEETHNHGRALVRLNEPDIIGDERAKVARLVWRSCPEQVLGNPRVELLQAQDAQHLGARLRAGALRPEDHLEQPAHRPRATHTERVFSVKMAPLADERVL